MGTDIHLYIERRNADGKWERVRPTAWTCPWCRGEGTSKLRDCGEEDCFWCEGKCKTTKEYHNRNYDLFAMLADVRNGTGFAGVDTGDGFEILAEPRGLPDDTCIKDTDEDVEYEDPRYIWLGDHSFSHATLAELLAYDYERTTHHRGVVNAAEYGAWVDAGSKGEPKSYCGGVMSPDCKMVSQERMAQALARGEIDTTVTTESPFGAPRAKDGFKYHTVVEWAETYRQSAGKAWFNFLEACKPLGDPENIRFVFGFDS